MPSHQWYSQDRDGPGVPLDRVPLELFNTPASSLNSSVAQCQHNIKEWIEGVVKAVQTVQKFLRKQHFQGDRGLDQKVLKVIQVRLVPSISRPGLGQTQPMGPCL